MCGNHKTECIHSKFLRVGQKEKKTLLIEEVRIKICRLFENGMERAQFYIYVGLWRPLKQLKPSVASKYQGSTQ